MSMAKEAGDFLKTRRKMNLAIVIANILVFIVLSFLGNPENASFMLKYGACYTPAIESGEYYRLFTAMFLHFSLPHLLYNMVCLITLGDLLEAVMGVWRYLLIYIGGGLGGNLLSLWLELRKRDGGFAVSAGASGAIFAVLGALLCVLILHPDESGRSRLTPQRMGTVVVMMLMQGFVDKGVDNAAHIGGLAAGLVLGIVLGFGMKRRMSHI